MNSNKIIYIAFSLFIALCFKLNAQEGQDAQKIICIDSVQNSYSTNNDDKNINLNDENNSVWWLQLGIGKTNSSKLNYLFSPTEFTKLEMNFNLRKSNHIYSIGIDRSFIICCWEMTTFWGGYGYSFNTPNTDMSASAGLSYSQWDYETESERGLIRSPGSFGLILRTQFLFRLRKVLGIGGVFTLNNSKEVSYTSFTFVLIFGNWDN